MPLIAEKYVSLLLEANEKRPTLCIAAQAPQWLYKMGLLLHGLLPRLNWLRTHVVQSSLRRHLSFPLVGERCKRSRSGRRNTLRENLLPCHSTSIGVTSKSWQIILPGG